jgi:hypothetical protein
MVRHHFLIRAVPVGAGWAAALIVNTPDTVELLVVVHSTDGSSLVTADTSSLITPMTKMFRSRVHNHSAASGFRFISLTIIRKEEI